MIRKYFIILLLFLLFQNIKSSGQISIPLDRSHQENSIADTNPKSVLKYTLKNGLTVYLNPDPNMNSVYGAVVIKGGAKNDPKDATGMAHYLEHMMFKGTHAIGTIDYKSEKIWLDSIAFMFDMLPYTTGDEAYRKRVYEKINYYSEKAAKYAVPGEFDKLISIIGGKGLNAFTDFEKIVYHNEFPKEYLNEWLQLYYDRLDKPVFRLFQTEIETVFEEKNMSQDNLYVNVYENLYKNFYSNSTYGIQTVLGSVEHLKNPSINKMASYYKSYYVANNMALILVGNFDLGTALTEIKSIFGRYKNGDKSPLKIENESPFDGRIQANCKLTPIPMGILGYRTSGMFDQDIPALDIIMNMLNNNQNTGYLDSLNQNNKLRFSMAVTDYHSDLGGFFIGYVPKIPTQTLKGGEKLILSIIEKIKKGNFSDEYLESIKKLILMNHELSLENPDYRIRKIADIYIGNASVKELSSYSVNIESLSRDDIINTATKYFQSNYLAFYSKIGSAKKVRLQKPALKPVKPEFGNQSEFYKNFVEKPDNKIIPKFIKRGIDYQFAEIKGGSNLYFVNNPYNQIFTYKINFYIGEHDLQGISLAADYLNNVGTDNLSFENFQHELKRLGTIIKFSANESFFTVSMTGFDSKFKESLLLLNDILQHPEQNNKVIKNFISQRKIENKLLKREASMKSNVLTNYALYGDNSPYILRLSLGRMKKIRSDDIIQIVQKAINYKADISYAGTIDFQKIENLISHFQYISAKPLISNSPVIKPMKFVQKDEIFFIKDNRSVQSKITICIPSKAVNRENRFIINAYNEYFGSGLNSVIFREIREYKALAYSAYANFYAPYKFSEPGFLFCATSTQADKTYETLTTFYGLLDSLKILGDNNYIQVALKNSSNINLPDFRNLSALAAKWQLMGYENDPRPEEIQFLTTMRQEDLLAFHNQYVANRRKIISIIGNDNIFNVLENSKFGLLKEVKFKSIFTK